MSYNTTQIEFIQFEDKQDDRIGLIEESAHIRGVNSLSDVDLLAVIVGSEDKSAALLEAAGSMRQLRQWSTEQIQSIKGIGSKLALRIRASFMIESRCASVGLVNTLDAPEAIYNMLKSEAATLDHEAFWLLILDRKNKVIRKDILFEGGISSCSVDVRLILKNVLLHNGCAFAVAHNHPSGNPSPSSSDIKITRQIREAARCVDLDFIEHIIIGDQLSDPNSQGYYSFSDAGLC